MRTAANPRAPTALTESSKGETSRVCQGTMERYLFWMRRGAIDLTCSAKMVKVCSCRDVGRSEMSKQGWMLSCTTAYGSKEVLDITHC